MRPNAASASHAAGTTTAGYTLNDGDCCRTAAGTMAQPLNPAALPVDPTELQRHSLLARGMAEGLVPFDGGALRPDVDVAPRTAIYSASGFDLMAVLARVVTRPNPKVDLGPVDFSCSFVVSDAKKPDNPVVYCSNTFSKLTGYSMSEILGRNCRFLQGKLPVAAWNGLALNSRPLLAPGGDVRPGEVRKYTDNAIIHEIKQKLASFEECQFILMNYKKNGEPFINLVTCIPVQWGEKPNDYRFMVGFQIDLVEQPQNILARLRDGTYTVNCGCRGVWTRNCRS